MYIRVSVGLRNTKECSMSYRQSKMYKYIYLINIDYLGTYQTRRLNHLKKFHFQNPGRSVF